MAQIQSFGTNVITIFPNFQRMGGGAMGSTSASERLKYEDALALKEQMRDLLDGVTAEVSRGVTVKYKNMNYQSSVLGAMVDYPTVRNAPLERGKWFDEAAVRSQQRVAVLGSTVVENLFLGGDPLNKHIRIAGQSFKVIGVMKPKAQMGFMDPNDQVFIPITTAMRRVTGQDFVRSIALQAKSLALTDKIEQRAEEVLRKTHKLGSSGQLDFRIFRQSDMIETAEESSRTQMYLLGAVALVSLLVGGIGIMNIMLVSVTERTREIGIRKAIGATRRDILLQFLIEALVLSALGGILGIVFGAIGSALIAKLAGWTMSVTPVSVILAPVFALAVGLIFGVWPARRAASLNPIEALRYE
jgi:ABC-type antimicrobial peptide transport system permease subunit